MATLSFHPWTESSDNFPPPPPSLRPKQFACLAVGHLVGARIPDNSTRDSAANQAALGKGSYWLGKVAQATLGFGVAGASAVADWTARL